MAKFALGFLFLLLVAVVKSKKEFDLTKRFLDDDGVYDIEIGNNPLFCTDIGPILGKLGGFHQGLLIYAKHANAKSKRWLLEYNACTNDYYPNFNPIDYIIPKCDWSEDGKTCENLYWYQCVAPSMTDAFEITPEESGSPDCYWTERTLVAKGVSGKLLNDAISGKQNTGDSFPNYYAKNFGVYTLFGIFHGKAAKWYDNLDAASSQCHDFARRFLYLLKEKYNVKMEETTFLRSYPNFMSTVVPTEVDPYNNKEDRDAVAKFFYPNGKKTIRNIKTFQQSVEELAKLMNGEENEFFPSRYYGESEDETEKDLYYISTHRYDKNENEKYEGVYFYKFKNKGLLSSIRIHQKYQDIPGSWY